ncbi:Protein of unknown function [Pedococcus dokdonensis]|uniref:DUF2752 domain-containing protein n=1 Tax=Pedococcus dokdonensis TaxID=443156 RepID=A0A1H0SSY2_9MICO|nr:DUF2752 domain-containing protein [Pedococcus dokdonensis]SDP44823.1 Protein of unknown function [Pedococcus dokdonensis]
MSTVAPQRPAPLATGGFGALRAPGLAATATVAVMTTVALVDPNQPGHYPTCPFLALSGYYCPGCGTLRGLHDLAHGDLAGALARNPLMVLAAGGLLVAFVLWSRRLWLGRPRTRVAPAALLYGLLALVLAFWVLRNVPGWNWLSPA